MGSVVSTVPNASPSSLRTALQFHVVAPSCDEQRKHVGLKNDPGENNCFLNSTVQALWHLDSFRNALVSAEISADQILLCIVQALFIQYQFTDLQIIPPTELRNALLFFDESKFRLGEYADASEAMEVILNGIHTDQVDASNPSSGCTPKCLSHQVFGGLYLSQCTCSCGATSEPYIDDSSFLLYSSASALISWHGRPSTTGRVTPVSFGQRLHHCLKTPQRSCPSSATLATFKTLPPCTVRTADTRTWCLEPPSVLAICVSWESECASASSIEEFLLTMEGCIFLDDVYRTDALPDGSVDAPVSLSCRSSTVAGVLPVAAGAAVPASRIQYIFRGFVCYYGRHYISMFQDWTRGKHVFLLFDDSNIREIGTWPHVVRECIAARYQPVLLLYERRTSDRPAHISGAV